MTDQMCYRPAALDDIPEMLEIERNSYSHPWSAGNFSSCFGKGYHNWVRIAGQNSDFSHNCIVSYGLLNLVLDEAQLLNICVSRAYQKQGIGRSMLLFLIERSRQEGAKSMFLEVRASNELALSLYSAVGFNEIGIRKGYYPLDKGREDAIVMALELEFFNE